MHRPLWGASIPPTKNRRAPPVTADRDTFDEVLDAFKAQMAWGHDTQDGTKQLVHNNLSGFISFARRQGFELIEKEAPAMDGEPRLRWQIAQRMIFIDGRMNSPGFIQRRHLEDKFQISKPQASIDLQNYMRRNPGRMTYDKSAKRYVAVASA